jgi:hypothetical protein
MNRSLLIALALLLAFSPLAFAQKKKRPAPSAKRNRTVAPAPPPPPDTRKEATETANTLKAITKFLFLYGKIANGMEVAEDQAKRSRVPLPAHVIEQNIRNKNGVLSGLTGLREQVDKLGLLLQANPRLQVPYVNLAGVTQKIAEAQGLVQNNQFDEAGRSLVTAAERLTEILLQVK